MLFRSGTSTLNSVSCTSLTDSGTLTVAGTSNLGNVTVSGTLGVSGQSTLADTTCLTLRVQDITSIYGQFLARGSEGTVLQDTRLTCYAQCLRETSFTMLIPVSPAPVQTVTYDTAISSNVQVGPIAEPYRTFTILYSGIYRCVFSLNGQMAADRDRKSTRLNSSHVSESRMPSSA